MKNNNTDNNQQPDNENSEQHNNNFSTFTSLKEPTPEFKEDLSSVMASPKQKFLILALLGLIASYLLFYFLVLKKPTPTNNQITSNNKVINGVATPSSILDEVPALPSLPPIPKIEDPITTQADTKEPITTKIVHEILPPPTPPTQNKIYVNQPPNLPASQTISQPAVINQNVEATNRLDAKRKSGIMLLAGKQVEKTPEQIKQDADFTARGNACLLLPRGKIIDAVIETAVNTDFGGEVKAIITRDVYAASGNRILIPKGSLVFGKYDTGFDGVYARIAINWFRIDLANSSYSVNILSPSVDNLGRAGATGKLDTRYKEKLGNAILSSAFNILLAKGLDKIIPPVVNSSVATSNQAIASQLNNIALGIYSDTTNTPAAKVSLICAQIQAAIPDKTSQSFISFATTCNTLMLHPTGTPQQTLDSLMAAVSATSSTLIANVTSQITPTQAQQASKQAFIDIAHTIQEIAIRDLPKATVTIDQGTHIRIYVNKDYNFPSVALSKVVRIK